MMLASPFLPPTMFSTQPNSEDPLHYRPSKDLETFNSLLPPPIEFVEGSSSGTLGVAEGKYEAINSSPKASKAELPGNNKPASSIPTKPALTPSRATSTKSASLHPDPIDLSWPQTCNRASGLYNNGNTCFMNSALQCLLHTPPLLKKLLGHKKEDCSVNSGFCMNCALRSVAVKAYTSKGPFLPSQITSNLLVIAKHMRKGRQEDTHEFIRYAIDALQKSCLAGHPPKMDPKLAETTWVHKVFGGRLRSRVTCRDCGHNSDTFDRILDLSLDIFKCDSLKQALRKFIQIDYLKGADKYKCDKCQKPVNAEKRFTIYEAPAVLTVHLKRFSPMGKKLSHLLQYDDELDLKPYMSADKFGPTYSLYGVICHAGGGPHSGHYYAFVKNREGRWHEMNDEMVSTSSVPTGEKAAYMLFYIQNKGQGLEAAVKAPLNGSTAPMKNGLAAGMKRKVQPKPKDTEDEDKGVKVEAPFIGPLLPSAEIKSPTPTQPKSPSSLLDPQAQSLRAKIDSLAKQKAQKALEILGNYDSDDDSDQETIPTTPTLTRTPGQDEEEPMDVDLKGKRKDNGETPPDEPEKPSSPPTLPPPSSDNSIPASSFYASVNKNKKRKSPDTSETQNSRRRHSQQSHSHSRSARVASNPFDRPFAKRKRMGL